MPRLVPFEGATAKSYVDPYWLDPITSEIDEIIGIRVGQRFFWFSAPRNHGKSTIIKGTIVKHLAFWPQELIGYFTNDDTLARKVSKDVRRVCEALGWKFRRDSNTQAEWELTSGGGLLAAPIGSVGHGRRLRLAIVDDPFKNKNDARSPARRDEVFGAIESDIMPMLHPDGAIVLTHARQDPDDSIGRAKHRKEWHGLNLRALTMVDGEEVPLWPERWSREFLQTKRRSNPSDFESQYQGEPRTTDGQVFRGVTRYHLVPGPDGYQAPSFERYRVAYGADCAYTEASQRRGDWSVLIKMYRVPDPAFPADREKDLYYVVDVVRCQKQAPEFLFDVKLAVQRENGRVRWYRYGAEKGVAQFMRAKVPQLREIAAPGDHGQRAQKYAEAWNQGRVLVPALPPDAPHDAVLDEKWEDFVAEHERFTGTESGVNDDQVDAGAAAFDELDSPEPTKGGGITTYQSPMDY